jgi:hypothetical protein
MILPLGKGAYIYNEWLSKTEIILKSVCGVKSLLAISDVAALL